MNLEHTVHDHIVKNDRKLVLHTYDNRFNATASLKVAALAKMSVSFHLLHFQDGRCKSGNYNCSSIMHGYCGACRCRRIKM